MQQNFLYYKNFYILSTHCWGIDFSGGLMGKCLHIIPFSWDGSKKTKKISITVVNIDPITHLTFQESFFGRIFLFNFSFSVYIVGIFLNSMLKLGAISRRLQRNNFHTHTHTYIDEDINAKPKWISLVSKI